MMDREGVYNGNKIERRKELKVQEKVKVFKSSMNKIKSAVEHWFAGFF